MSKCLLFLGTVNSVIDLRRLHAPCEVLKKPEIAYINYLEFSCLFYAYIISGFKGFDTAGLGFQVEWKIPGP